MARLLPGVLVACLVLVPFVGVRIADDGGLTFRPVAAAVCVALAVAVAALGAQSSRRFGLHRAITTKVRNVSRTSFAWASSSDKLMLAGKALFLLALVFPLFGGRGSVDLLTLILTYAVLAAALNLLVGYTGLLDLGFIAYFALGAYTYAILSTREGIAFWRCLPLAALVPACVSLLLGMAVLRLRGDYFAIVTLGFLQIVDTLIINLQGLTNGSQGITGIPRPTLFGLAFSETGSHTFAAVTGLAYDPRQRIVFLYYLVLALLLLANWLSARLRRLPLGRAWEALREDEIAAASLGIARAPAKLAAYAISAAIAGATGEIFAARQGFISPESFTFLDSAIVLAIVVLGGSGNRLGILFAALFLIGAPEVFRHFADYRMLVFGGAMVLVMLVRPRGLAAARHPAVSLP